MSAGSGSPAAVPPLLDPNGVQLKHLRLLLGVTS